ncbi:MAG: DNA polymerase III subunit delta [Gammaproteobacteria bacterium]|jgi:DNA polymerase III subunit delta
MQVRLEQLDGQLNGGLAPVYLLYGEETLLVQEAADAIRARARAEGYSSREVMHVESGFDWNALAQASNSLSLFAERRIIELRIPGAKPGDAGAKALRAYAERPPEDTLLLVIAGKLDAAARRSQWVKALEGAGVGIPVWPVDARRLPAWIRRRMEQAGLHPTPAAISLLADRVEGNLLACAQEIEKLRLLQEPGPVDAEAVAAAVTDSARFDVFTLVDSALGGAAARSNRILAGLRAEGVEPVLVLWALARELRVLAAMAREVAAGESPDRVLARRRVWDSRKPALKAALGRYRAPAWQSLLRQCAVIDRMVKGQAPGNPWDELVQLTLRIAGHRLVSAH